LLDLEVVTSDGAVIHTGTRAKKSSSGYHLTGLFAGSEGTLGLITKITLKLHGIPEHVIAARCTFPTLEACSEAAKTILWSGVPIKSFALLHYTLLMSETCSEDRKSTRLNSSHVSISYANF